MKKEQKNTGQLQMLIQKQECELVKLKICQSMIRFCEFFKTTVCNYKFLKQTWT